MHMKYRSNTCSKHYDIMKECRRNRDEYIFYIDGTNTKLTGYSWYIDGYRVDANWIRMGYE